MSDREGAAQNGKMVTMQTDDSRETPGTGAGPSAPPSRTGARTDPASAGGQQGAPIPPTSAAPRRVVDERPPIAGGELVKLFDDAIRRAKSSAAVAEATRARSIVSDAFKDMLRRLQSNGLDDFTYGQLTNIFDALAAGCSRILESFPTAPDCQAETVNSPPLPGQREAGA